MAVPWEFFKVCLLHILKRSNQRTSIFACISLVCSVYFVSYSPHRENGNESHAGNCMKFDSYYWKERLHKGKCIWLLSWNSKFGHGKKTYDKSSQSWWTKQKEKMSLLFKNKGQFFVPALKWNLIENQHINLIRRSLSYLIYVVYNMLLK